MGLKLTIDQGNSSAKIVVWEADAGASGAPRPLMQETLPKLYPERLEEIVAQWAPTEALCCSVTGNGPRISRWLRQKGVPGARELASDMPLPLKISYATPATLGEDRVAAAVGAWSLCPGQELLVVDMGTAVTYDRVDAGGVFLGGNISPGVGMRLRSLHSFTARLPKVDGYGDTPLFGVDTVTAMRSGAIHGVAAEMAFYRSQLGPGARVVATGGWANHVCKFLPFDVTVDPCLVTKGLLSIMLYNENIR